jgi:Flp pilus assembly protein TadD
MKLAPILSAGVALVLAACGTDLDPAARGDDYSASVKQADEARKSGDFESAIPLYGRALQADPRDYRTLNAYGVVLDMMGRHTEAQARYRQGIEIAPDFMALRSNYGLSLAISGQAQEAIAQLVPLMGSRGADGRVRQNLAFAYAMNGDLESCLQISRRDLDEASAQRQLHYFMQLRALPVELRSAELRRNPNFFPQSAASG